MKKLSELGVSPAPWVQGTLRHDMVLSGPLREVVTMVSLADERFDNNLSLIAAAPELYEALRTIYEVMANGKEYLPRDWSERARAALEKAGGAK